MGVVPPKPPPQKPIRYTLWKCSYCDSLNKIGDHWKCQDCGAARPAAKPADIDYEAEQEALRKFREKYG